MSFDEMEGTVAGLYAWVIDPGGESDLLAAPVIYIGIGAGKDGGLRRRLSGEIDGVNFATTDPDDWSYIHPRAIARLNGKPVGGTIERTSAVRNLTWLDDVRDRPPMAATGFRMAVVGLGGRCG